MNRRAFLSQGAGALAAAAGFTSCSTIHDAASRRVPGITGDDLIIDAHTHLFNAHDLYLYNYMAMEMNNICANNTRRWAMQKFGESVKRASEDLRRKAPDGSAEETLLKVLVERRAALLRPITDPLERHAVAERFIDTEVARVVKKLLEKKRYGHSGTDAAYEVARELSSAPVSGSAIDPAVAAYLRSPAETGFNDRYHPPKDSASGTLRAIFSGDNPLIEALASWGSSVWPRSFLGSLSQARLVNAWFLRDSYPQGSLFAVAAVDMDRWTRWEGDPIDGKRPPVPINKGRKDDITSHRPPASTSISQQVRINALLSVIFNGRLAPFVPFCPMRQAEWDSPDYNGRWWTASTDVRSPLENVKLAVETWGHVGVKLYPPLGFCPSGNADFEDNWVASLKAYRKGWGPRLDRAMERLFAYCDGTGAAIMAHTYDSHGPSCDHQQAARPFRWKPVIAKHSGLRLNLAHFGGHSDSNIPPTDHSDWVHETIEFLGKHNRVFADVGDFGTGMFKNKHAAFLHRVLTMKSTEPGWDSSRIPGRILYGTDWFMCQSSFTSKKYLAQWHGTLSNDPLLRPHRHAMMGWNAAHFLGLAKDAPNRRRLDDFNTRHRVDASWCTLVDRGQPAVV
jgi:hypothetical protein